MRIIFCDESGLLPKDRYLWFGSLWLPQSELKTFRKGFYDIWDRNFTNRNSEIKWTKVSNKSLDVYMEFVDYFAQFPDAEFRAVCIDKRTIDYATYHNKDVELGFYKFLYVFLSRNIEKDYKYRGYNSNILIKTDRRKEKDNSEFGRLPDLKHFLNKRLENYCPNCTHPMISNIESIDSKMSPEIQIADVLLGSLAYNWEGYTTSNIKLKLSQHVRDTFGLNEKQTTPFVTYKFNIWELKLNGQNGRPGSYSM